MNWIDSAIENLAPGLAAKRLASRAKLQMARRMYDALGTQRARPRRGTSASGNAVMDTAQAAPREWARWLDENHDLAIGVLDDLVSNTVGTGVGMEPVVKTAGGKPAAELNEQIRKYWKSFWRYPEITRDLPGPEVERLICRTWLRDGEVFVQHVTAPEAVSDLDVPYQISPLEPDFVPYNLWDRDQRVTHGVVRDKFGRSIAYHIYKQHPGDTGIVGTKLGITGETIPVSAANISHLKFSRRFHQIRGVSIFHGVLARLDDLKDYEESERMAARFAAAMVAYIRKPGMVDAPIDSITGDREFNVEPGIVFDGLLAGEDMGLLDSKRPNNNIDKYISIQERRVAAGTGSRYSSISRNYNGTYSSQRQELVEGTVHYRKLFSYLATKFYLSVWMRFIDVLVISGKLRLPANIDTDSLYFPQIRPPSLPWIDPLKEIEAYALAMENHFLSRQQIIRDLGGDPKEVDSLFDADSFSNEQQMQPQNMRVIGNANN